MQNGFQEHLMEWKLYLNKKQQSNLMELVNMIEFYPYDGGVIKQEWHSTARQRGWNEERKRTTTEKRLKTLEARKNAKEC